ncbi:transposase [Streptomyces sp. NPDC050523]|uniref:transposase n=1 Tax=Streptomyces sp. NPDC050523 TaxID=3365622 RepID=UPI0037B57D9B
MTLYPPEFKANAVALYRSRPGVTIKQVAADLGVNTETLRNWTRAADGLRSSSHVAHPVAGDAAPGSVEAELAAAWKKFVSWRRNGTSCARRRSSSRPSLPRNSVRHALPPPPTRHCCLPFDIGVSGRRAGEPLPVRR